MLRFFTNPVKAAASAVSAFRPSVETAATIMNRELHDWRNKDVKHLTDKEYWEEVDAHEKFLKENEEHAVSVHELPSDVVHKETMKSYSEREKQQFKICAEIMSDILSSGEDVSAEEFGKRLKETGMFNEGERVTRTVGQDMEDSLRILRLQRITTEKKMEEKHSSPRP